MIVGVLKEIKSSENRVSMTPAGVEVLKQKDQVVLVAKLTAVFQDESGETAPKLCGLSGRNPCTRCKAYTTSSPRPLKSIMAMAYTFQFISSSG